MADGRCLPDETRFGFPRVVSRTGGGDSNDDCVHCPAIMSCQGSGVRVGVTSALWYSYCAFSSAKFASINFA